MEPTQFFLDALAEVPYDEDSSKALLGLDEWKIPESIYYEDGSCMSLCELARFNGYEFEGENDFDHAFAEFGVNPVVGPATLDHLELGPELSTPIVTDDVATLRTCAKQSSTVYPLDTLNSLENAELGPPLAVVQVTPATAAPVPQHASTSIGTSVKVAPVTQASTTVTQRAPVTIDPPIQTTISTGVPVTRVTTVTQFAPITIEPATQVASPISSSATGLGKVITLSEGKSRSQPAKRQPKQRAKQAPKNKEDDELHNTQKKTKAQSTPRKAKGKTTVAPKEQSTPPKAKGKTTVSPKAQSTPRKAKGKTTVAPATPLQKIAPAPITPMSAPLARFPAPVTPVTGVTRTPVANPSQQQQLQSREQCLRMEWERLQQHNAQLKQQKDYLEQQQPNDQQRLQVHERQWKIHQQQFAQCYQNIMQYRQQVRYQQQQQHQQFQTAVAQQVQQPTPNMQAVYPTTFKGNMQPMMQQSHQLQAPATQQVQQVQKVQHPTQHNQKCYPTPPKERAQSMMQQLPVAQQARQLTQPMQCMQPVMQQPQRFQAPAAHQVQQPTPNMQAVYPTTPKARMQPVMQQSQQFQASAAQHVQPPVQPEIYPSPPESMQSISSLSAPSPGKRTFEFMENIMPKNFVANPNNHARWSFTPNGDRTYLNGSQAKKARVSKK
ncbi:uncharacterized protein N7479_002115 [Penicillium vulpinum]|uniref:Uncharacterized protein n=1 Tax=Penicillium vulpinum TaxID=29845 RepID=A0A1V6S7D4_9EURO|nr:uncharacterized protein N7479_002115 [Penicillium vulpinum]KAJ5972197.1 hypothetical protein N7479_002115 [Penicillium vulpinum]OQE09967.1 hypothetical protein PENVUL_c005G09654 [Penicillium vulpinum]